MSPPSLLALKRSLAFLISLGLGLAGLFGKDAVELESSANSSLIFGTTGTKRFSSPLCGRGGGVGLLSGTSSVGRDFFSLLTLGDFRVSGTEIVFICCGFVGVVGLLSEDDTDSRLFSNFLIRLSRPRLTILGDLGGLVFAFVSGSESDDIGLASRGDDVLGAGIGALSCSLAGLLVGDSLTASGMLVVMGVAWVWRKGESRFEYSGFDCDLASAFFFRLAL